MPPKVVRTVTRAVARRRHRGPPSPKGVSASAKKDSAHLKRIGGASKHIKRGKPEKEETKQKKRVKKWLKTAADWARFEAWAKKNAQPKKYPEPEPIVRPSKPLHKLLRRIELLIEPPQRASLSELTRPVHSPVSKAALNAEFSKRTLKLALPKLRLVDYGRELPVQVCKEALCYEPSRRILCLSQPVDREREECKPIAIPADTQDKECAQRRLCELIKKLNECPEGLTDEERDELFTAAGIRRTALEYKITPWLQFLALPWYKNIRPRNDKQAKEWKKLILTNLEQRGKKALEWQRKKKQKKDKEEEEGGEEDEEDEDEEEDIKGKKRKKGKEGKKEKEKRKGKEEKEKRKGKEEKEKKKGKEAKGKKEEKKGKEAKGKKEEKKGKEAKGKKEEKKGKEAKGKKEKKKGKDDKGKGDGKKAADEEAKAQEEAEQKRKQEKHAWRFAPLPYKSHSETFLVKKAALQKEASPRTIELAKAKTRPDLTTKKDPFAVKKGALSVTSSGRVSELATPKNPEKPVTKPPPREKDKYGRPIIPMPKYGKVLPKTKPYKMGECPKKEDKEEKKEKKPKPIDPIVYEPTIDPCLDPDRAKKQKKERERAMKLLIEKRKAKQEKKQAMENKKKN